MYIESKRVLAVGVLVAAAGTAAFGGPSNTTSRPGVPSFEADFVDSNIRASSTTSSFGHSIRTKPKPGEVNSCLGSYLKPSLPHSSEDANHREGSSRGLRRARERHYSVPFWTSLQSRKWSFQPGYQIEKRRSLI
jgi:hypothetical protein